MGGSEPTLTMFGGGVDYHRQKGANVGFADKPAIRESVFLRDSELRDRLLSMQ